MTIPTFTSPIAKIAVVVICLALIALMKYGLKWSDNNVAEEIVEEIIEKEIGVEIVLPDLPSSPTTTTTTPANTTNSTTTTTENK